MNRINTRYIWNPQGKENHPQYQISNTGTYITKAHSNNYHYRNNRWQPYCLQKYRTTPEDRNTSRQYHQQQIFQQSHYPQLVKHNQKPLGYRNPYQLRNTKQPWFLSQPTSSIPNTLVQSTVNSLETYKQGTSSHDISTFQNVRNINLNNECLISVGQQVKILQDRGVTTNINITEPYGNHKQDGQSDVSGSVEMRIDINNIQDNQKHKTVEREPRPDSNKEKWKIYKAKYGNELNIKSTVHIKSPIDEMKDNTCSLKHIYIVETYFENSQKEKEICELENCHIEPMNDSNETKVKSNQIKTKWKLYKIKHGNELKVKSNLTPMYTSKSHEKMNNILPNFNRKYLTTFSKSIIENLYFGNQCSICSERRISNIKDHMDGHFRENSFAKYRKYPKYRYWYLEEDYVDENPFEVLLKKHQKKKTKVIKRPRHHSGNDVCLVCKEKFTEYFNHEDSEWQLNDAICLDGKTYHEICADDRDNI